jgi:uncharacterized membrane protein YdjX (TVP38/TMEM64 family)
VAAVAIALLGLVLMGVFWLLDVPVYVESGSVRHWVRAVGPAGPAAFVLLLAVAAFLPVVPNTPLFVAAGVLWGPYVGSVYSMLGLMLGSSAAFFTARWLGRRHLEWLLGGSVAARLDRFAGRAGWKTFFWARLLPATNFDWLNFIAGFTPISFRQYASATALGVTLPTVLTVVAGHALTDDIRVTLALVGAWAIALAASAAWLGSTHRPRRGRPW